MAGLEKRPENRPASCGEMFGFTIRRGRADGRRSLVNASWNCGHAVGFTFGAIVFLCGWLAVRYDGISGFARMLDAIGASSCILTNISSQVELVTKMKMVSSDVLIEELGLRRGCDLNAIDLLAKKNEVLSRIPNIRTLSIARKCPDRIVIAVEERVPFVRLGIAGSKQLTGRVADSEGVVFCWHRGTQNLPLILEDKRRLTEGGHRLSGQVFAALSLIKACEEAEFAAIRVCTVDASQDILMATLDNSSCVRITWNGMLQGGASAEQDLRRRLGFLVKAMATKVTGGTMMWNLTKADRVYADTHDKTLDRPNALDMKTDVTPADGENPKKKGEFETEGGYTVAQQDVVRSALLPYMWVEKWENGRVVIRGRTSMLKEHEAEAAARNGGKWKTAPELVVNALRQNATVNAGSVKIASMSLDKDNDVKEFTLEIKFK